MPDILPDDEIRGLAIAGWSLAMALFASLVGKKIITRQQADHLVNVVLTSLDTFQGPDDPGIQKARMLVEGLAQATASNRGK